MINTTIQDIVTAFNVVMLNNIYTDGYYAVPIHYQGGDVKYVDVNNTNTALNFSDDIGNYYYLRATDNELSVYATERSASCEPPSFTFNVTLISYFVNGISDSLIAKWVSVINAFKDNFIKIDADSLRIYTNKYYVFEEELGDYNSNLDDIAIDKLTFDVIIDGQKVIELTECLPITFCKDC